MNSSLVKVDGESWSQDPGDLDDFISQRVISSEPVGSGRRHEPAEVPVEVPVEANVEANVEAFLQLDRDPSPAVSDLPEEADSTPAALAEESFAEESFAGDTLDDDTLDDDTLDERTLTAGMHLVGITTAAAGSPVANENAAPDQPPRESTRPGAARPEVQLATLSAAAESPTAALRTNANSLSFVPRVRVKALMEGAGQRRSAVLDIDGIGTMICHEQDVVSLHELAPGNTLEIRAITKNSVVFGLNGQHKEYTVQ